MTSVPPRTDGDFQIEPIPGEIVAPLLALLGYSTDLVCSRWTYRGVMHGSDGYRWSGMWEHIHYERTGEPMGIVRARVMVRPPVYLERLFPATGEQRESIHGLEELTATEIDRARRELWDAARIIREIDFRGRKPRTEDPTSNWIELTEKAIALKARNRRLTWEIIATAHIGIDPKTLHTWRKDYARLGDPQQPK